MFLLEIQTLCTQNKFPQLGDITLANDVLDLKRQYSDVLEPIQKLTENVDNVTNDVRQLTQELRRTAGDVGAIKDIAAENARQITDISTSLRFLTTKSTTHEEELTTLGIRFGKFSVLVNIFWAIMLLALGAVITLASSKMFSGD